MTQSEQPTPQPVRPKLGGLAIAVLTMSFVVGGIAGGLFGLLATTYVNESSTSSSSTTHSTPATMVSVQEDSATVDVVDTVLPSVVSVILTQDASTAARVQDPFQNFFSPFFEPQIPEGERQVGAGSGFIVSSDGYILTNRHVVNDSNVNFTVVLNDGTQYPATLVGTDPFNDLAVLDIEAHNLPVVELGDSDTLQLGQTVIAIGNALEFQNSVTRGVLSGVNRTITAGDGLGQTETIEEALQTDAAINPGNSGGPLVNLAGQVVGVNTAVSQEGQLVGFAIPVNTAEQVIDSVLEFGKIVRPYLGVRYIVVDARVQEENNLSVDYGALIVRGDTPAQVAVIPGSPADKAGLVENDIILEFNGEQVSAENSLAKLIRDYRVGDTIALKILHDGEEQELSVTLEAYE